MAIVALNPGVINTDMLTSCFGSSSSLYQTPESWYVFQFFTRTNFLLGIVIFICTLENNTVSLPFVSLGEILAGYTELGLLQ